MAVSADSTGAPASPPAPISLTKKGEAYAARQLRPLGCPTGVEPETWRKAIFARVEALQVAQERLIAALDQMDGDPDLEDNADDEPSVCGAYADQFGVDLEADDADKEPSLGWSNHTNQALIATENTFHDERESDGLERGEFDEGEGDDFQPIPGAGYRL